MFKSKATVIGFAGNPVKYPCHFRHEVGDVIVFDGEKIIGRLCPHIMPKLAAAFSALYASGGRNKEGEAPGSYYPFWHSPLSLLDPAGKKTDGVGFRSTLVRPEEGYRFVVDESLFDVPPNGVFFIGKGTEKNPIMVTCGDPKTLAQFRVEAFDLADHGDAIPYYRRSMAILARIAARPGVAMDKIINEFSRNEVENIYPTLGKRLVAVLVGELELMGYVTNENDIITITPAGRKKLASFKKTLTAEEKKALRV
jgi:uncharacterized repeat protein (TIGR04076 family)